jgi:hypothetical protein
MYVTKFYGDIAQRMWIASNKTSLYSGGNWFELYPKNLLHLFEFTLLPQNNNFLKPTVLPFPVVQNVRFIIIFTY